MSLAESLGPHLPYLRRYARALTGQQSQGDHLVKVTLQALALHPTELDRELPARTALYSFFHRVTEKTETRLDRANTDSSVVDVKLQTLTPIHRQAFLLSAVEGFGIADIASILNRSATAAEGLIAQAQTEIEDQLRTRVMIIEDEPFISSDLENIVSDLGHEVTGIAVTRSEAVALVDKVPPGIVLCDIQLADNSSGIDAANDILAKFDVPLIFITAFPERLLTGNKPEPAYLITKPFRANTVKATIGQALFFHTPATAA